MEWQPIDTAPKDGTWIWGVEPGEPLGWDVPRQCAMFWQQHSAMKKGGYWRKVEQDIGPVTFPTHWMPLPAPPTSATPSRES